MVASAVVAEAVADPAKAAKVATEAEGGSKASHQHTQRDTTGREVQSVLLC